MENNIEVIIITSIVGVMGILVTLMGISELKSTIKSKELTNLHKKYHAVLILIPLLIPFLYAFSEWKNDQFHHLFQTNIWTTYLLYNLFMFYLLVHFRGERKNKHDEEISLKLATKIMFIKLKDLFTNNH
jgi:Ca2+/Na+ antiporter